MGSAHSPHRRTVFSVLAAAVTAGLALSACGGGSDSSADPAPSSPTSSSVATAPDETSDSSSTTPLDGTWTMGPMTSDDIAATLTSHGLGRWVDKLQKGDKRQPDSTATYTLELGSGFLTLWAAIDDVPRVRYDLARYEVDGRTLKTIADDGCFATFHWRKVDRTVRLSLIADNCPPWNGIPDRALQLNYYTTRPLVPAES